MKKSLERLAPPAALALTIGVLGVTGHFSSGDRSSADKPVTPSGGLTEAQLKDWPKAQTDIVTVSPGEGAQAVGMQVDPEVYAGPYSSTETSDNLTKVIQAQAPGSFLQEGQKVIVPDVHAGIPQANPEDPNIQPAGQ